MRPPGARLPWADSRDVPFGTAGERDTGTVNHFAGWRESAEEPDFYMDGFEEVPSTSSDGVRKCAKRPVVKPAPSSL